MRNSTPFVSALFAACLFLGACGSSGPRVRSAVERQTDYSRFETFAVTNETVSVEGGAPEGSAAVARQVREALVRAFEARGLRETDAGDADLSIEFAIQGHVRTTSVATVHGVANAPITLVEGALAVFVLERTSQQLLWTGYTRDDWISSGQRTRAQETVDAIMGEFPR